MGHLLTAGSLKLPEVLFHLLLLFLPHLLLFLLTFLALLRPIVFSFNLPDLGMELPEEMLRVHRVVLDLIGDAFGFLVLVKQEIILLGLATIDDILL